MAMELFFDNLIKIEEATFQNKEITKVSSNYGDYFEKVVNDILSLNPIRLDGGKTFAFDNKDDDKYKEFEAKLDELRSETDYTKKCNMFKELTGIKWNDIHIL